VAADLTTEVRSRALAFAPDARTLVSVDNDALVRLWDVEEQRLRTALFPYADRVVALSFSLAFSPDRHLLATGGADGTIVLWHVPTRRPVATLRGHTGAIHALVFA